MLTCALLRGKSVSVLFTYMTLCGDGHVHIRRDRIIQLKSFVHMECGFFLKGIFPADFHNKMVL